MLLSSTISVPLPCSASFDISLHFLICWSILMIRHPILLSSTSVLDLFISSAASLFCSSLPLATTDRYIYGLSFNISQLLRQRTPDGVSFRNTGNVADSRGSP